MLSFFRRKKPQDAPAATPSTQPGDEESTATAAPLTEQEVPVRSVIDTDSPSAPTLAVASDLADESAAPAMPEADAGLIPANAAPAAPAPCRRKPRRVILCSGTVIITRSFPQRSVAR